MGCMAQSRGAELVEQVPHLDLVAGTQKYHRVVDHVVEIMRKKDEAEMDDLRAPIVDIEEETESQNTIRDHLDKSYGVSEFVSIMQGCNMKCTFCIVPYTRGAERGRPIPDIVEQKGWPGFRDIETQEARSLAGGQGNGLIGCPVRRSSRYNTWSPASA